jgi:hypothetical protein
VAAAPIPDDIRRFVLTSVPSVPFIEALLVFRDTREAIGIDYVSRRLYISEQAAGQVVAQLRETGIVRDAALQGAVYRYAPRDDELAALLDRLAALYATHLIEVTQLIHSRTERAARQFADAFRLRKDS